jgi:hypothetical protein
VPVSVGGLAGAVGTSLISAVAGAASVTGLDRSRDGRGVDCNGSNKSEDDSGDLHGERLVVGWLRERFLRWKMDWSVKSAMKGGELGLEKGVLRSIYAFQGTPSILFFHFFFSLLCGAMALMLRILTKAVSLTQTTVTPELFRREDSSINYSHATQTPLIRHPRPRRSKMKSFTSHARAVLLNAWQIAYHWL